MSQEHDPQLTEEIEQMLGPFEWTNQFKKKKDQPCDLCSTQGEFLLYFKSLAPKYHGTNKRVYCCLNCGGVTHLLRRSRVSVAEIHLGIASKTAGKMDKFEEEHAAQQQRQGNAPAQNCADSLKQAKRQKLAIEQFEKHGEQNWKIMPDLYKQMKSGRMMSPKQMNIVERYLNSLGG